MTTMDASEVIERFRRSGALLEGHFLLTSGLHSSGYLQCALVLQHPREAEALGAVLGERVRSLGAQAVLSPALGGIVIGQEVARVFHALATVSLPTYEPDACPLCLEGQPVVKPGSRV